MPKYYPLSMVDIKHGRVSAEVRLPKEAVDQLMNGGPEIVPLMIGDRIFGISVMDPRAMVVSDGLGVPDAE